MEVSSRQATTGDHTQSWLKLENWRQDVDAASNFISYARGIYSTAVIRLTATHTIDAAVSHCLIPSAFPAPKAKPYQIRSSTSARRSLRCFRARERRITVFREMFTKSDLSAFVILATIWLVLDWKSNRRWIFERGETHSFRAGGAEGLVLPSSSH